VASVPPGRARRAMALNRSWVHMSGFFGRVTLDLWFGDINELTRELDDSLNQQVDAWFLDGFAPSCRPRRTKPAEVKVASVPPGRARRAMALNRSWVHNLWFGDINELTRELDDSLNQQVDAWFLDGFAPAKVNPASCRPRRTKPAEVKVASVPPGRARRAMALNTKGFGRKREMLTGEMAQTLAFPARAPWFARRGSESAPWRLPEAPCAGASSAQ
jgi:tRNA U34 5-methylaminomethyl-2-thiouridine-forming methyltransferase MnmC